MKKLIFAAVLSAVAFFAQGQGVVDVHSHILPQTYIEYLAAHDALMDEGFPLPKWSAEAQLKWMDEAGVETAILTLAAPHPLFGDKVENAAQVRKLNETAAKLKEEHPGRFLFCAALPLPDVEAALKELDYAFDVLHADGVKLATNAGGQYLGDPALDELFAALDRRKAVVILHPHRPEPVSREVMRQTPLAMQEYLSETTRAVCNMITRNVPARYPNVRIVVPHCGAYLPLAIPRMKALTPVMQKNGLVGEIDYEANLRQLYYDLAGAHSPQAIRQLLTITTPDHILYGSDFPYAAPRFLTAGLGRMKGYLSEESDLAPYRDMILSDNAKNLFAISKNSNDSRKDENTMENLQVRIAEIEVFPEWLDAYLAAAGDVGAESVAKEPGVVCIFPMQRKDNPCLIRIVEIYRSEEAYKAHLATPHFLKYKEGTPHMIKSLELVPMRPLDAEHMNRIFRKEGI